MSDARGLPLICFEVETILNRHNKISTGSFPGARSGIRLLRHLSKLWESLIKFPCADRKDGRRRHLLTTFHLGLPTPAAEFPLVLLVSGEVYSFWYLSCIVHTLITAPFACTSNHDWVSFNQRGCVRLRSELPSDISLLWASGIRYTSETHYANSLLEPNAKKL